MDTTSLVGGADHHLADRVDQAGVVVGEDQADPAQAAFAQVTQELGPERLGLAVADHDAEDLPAAVLGDTGGDDHGPGGDLVVDPGLAVGGVEVDVGEAGVVQRPRAEGGQRLVQGGADPGDLALGYPGVRPQGLDQIVDRPGGDALDVRLHDDGIEGLVDAAPPLQQAGEEAAGPQFGDGQLQVAGLCGERLVPVPVAVVGAGVGVLVPLGSDLRRGLGLDQFLQHPLGDAADEFESLGRTQ